MRALGSAECRLEVAPSVHLRHRTLTLRMAHTIILCSLQYMLITPCAFDTRRTGPKYEFKGADHRHAYNNRTQIGRQF